MTTVFTLLPLIGLALANQNLQIDELPGTDQITEWLTYTYHSFFLIFGDYLPSSGQLMFAAAIIALIVYNKTTKKKKGKHSSHSSSRERERR